MHRDLISVNTLSKCVYCPRAGVITHELSAGEEVDEPARQFNLDYAPPFHLAGIQEAIGRLSNSLTRWGATGFAALMTAGLALLFGFRGLLIPLGMSVAVISWQMAKRINRVVELSEWRNAALRASPKEPTPTEQQHEGVNWWEMLAAGYESVTTREQYRDDELGIIGRPWRVLRKGSLRIPVIKLRADEATTTPPPHDAVQLAAYCRLLKICEGMESPYAILLFGDNWDGLAVANCDALQQLLTDAVRFTRDVLTASEFNSICPPAPEPSTPCQCCPFGVPALYDIAVGSQSWSNESRVHGVPMNGHVYHSCCGDRFEWTPPHKTAIRLGLVD